MYSEIAKRLKLKYSPIAILSTSEKPQGALEFTEGRWGCIVAMLTAAAKGRRAVFSRSTFGCEGGGIGLGFVNQCSEGMEYFLSTGKEGCFEGEAIKKTPESAKNLIESVISINIIPEQYVVFAPLIEVDATKDEPKVVVFYVNPDQLTALVVLANYARPSIDNVVIPATSSCQAICRIPWGEVSQEHQRAVVGMMDIKIRPLIDADLLSFSVPYAMFKEMEENIPGSFLDKHEWNKVADRIQCNK